MTIKTGCTNVYFVVVILLVSSEIVLKNVKAQWSLGLGPQKAKVTTSSEWIHKSLEVHNFFRSLHGSPPLVINNSLSEISQYYANYLLQRALRDLDQDGNGRGKKVYFEHNPELKNSGIGENLYYSIMSAPITPIPASYAILLWYEEIKDYDFAKGQRKTTSKSDAMIGHLTQLLWKDTKEMGTAYASHKFRNNLTIVFVVANYHRQGNVILTNDPPQLYLKNVLPPEKTEHELNAEIVKMNVNSWTSEFDQPKSETSNSWRQAALEVHNYFRSLHGSQDLHLNDDICKLSQLYAESLLADNMHSFDSFGEVHRIRKNFISTEICNMGESSTVFISEKTRPSAEFIVKSWHRLIKNYNFDSGAPRNRNFRTEQFQQLVWNSTTEFCISYATKRSDSGQYMTYIVANYYPTMTNKDYESKINVSPLKKEPDEEIDFDDGDDCKCSTLASTILTVILCLAAIVLVFVGIMLLLKKYYKPTYNTTMKCLRLKKY